MPAASDVVVSLPVGKHRARAVTADGIEVDALDLDVTSGKRVLAWNLGGAMPVLLLDIVYSSALASVAKSSRDGSKPADDPEPPPRAIYCGQRLIQLLSVDYAFRPPDEKLGVKGGSGRVVKTYLGYEKGAKDNPRRCFSYLMQKGREAEAAGFLETAARIARWDPEISRASQGTATTAIPPPTEAINSPRYSRLKCRFASKLKYACWRRRRRLGEGAVIAISR